MQITVNGKRSENWTGLECKPRRGDAHALGTKEVTKEDTRRVRADKAMIEFRNKHKP